MRFYDYVRHDFIRGLRLQSGGVALQTVAVGATRGAGLALVVAAVVLGAASAVYAQKIYTIGSLNTGSQFVNAFAGFKSRMVDLGYKEGERVRYDYHNSRGDSGRLRSMAQKLVDDKVDMVVTTSTTGTVAAAKATLGTGIPVVFLSAGNPEKLVKSYSSSGSNLAGISSASMELVGKRFEVLRELYPGIKRIAMPVDPNGVNYRSIMAEIKESPPRLGFVVSEVHVRSVAEIAKVAPSITRKNYDAIFTPADSMVTEGIEPLIQQSIKEKLPAVTSLLVNVKRGCLFTLASDYVALGKQGAVLADKILKGTKPADLPIELPDKILLVLNLTTAKAIGLTVPREILLRADETYE